ncbi:TIR domain-containing protein [Caballeronia sp. INDeC2]|uniref:TIR domain-containing protein n=1 Tax=Caballeronia sp. INDeC2 TaxID=2921747 RepID=UPI002028C6DE|nr:TIR domain-containing protein [Caballeronia sp. INDeC2]
MKERFEGEAGRRRLIEALREQRTVAGNEQLATDLANLLELVDIKAGDALIEQGADDNDMYFLLGGTFDVSVNGKKVAQRSAGDHVGEMAALLPFQLRSASVISVDGGVVGKLTEPQLVSLGKAYPDIWRWIAKELSRRLLQRNRLVAEAREKIRIFVISSVEALPIARAVENAFEYDDYNVTLWTHDVFKASRYPIESLEAELDVSDFAIAIVQPDDVTKMRGEDRAVPRDNVIFELGFFMGRLGRERAILMEPRGEEVSLPTDLSGITTIPYKYADGKGLAAAMGPACNRLRSLINELGVFR